MTQIRPQQGPQEAFLSTPADIAIYGGAAGGGKTFALLMEPLRHIKVKDFGATVFRRTSPMITTEGGLWDTSAELYQTVGAKPRQMPLRWTFPSGAKIEFHHLQYDKDVYNWQGAQVPLIEFDELTQFTKKQFFYLLSRNRSLCGVKPYMRAATNPDPDSWVKDMVRWYLDDEGEYPDPEKSGAIRYMVRSGDDILWFDTIAEAKEYAHDIDPGLEPLSFTFIPSNVYDNKILLDKDPGYLAKLKALPRVERMRLEQGNWKIRATAGTIFARTDFEIIDSAPQPDREVRFWDRAASEPTAEYPDPDWTAGVKMQRTGNTFIVTDVTRCRKKAGEVKQLIKNTASQDSRACQIGMFQDPGQAGKFEVSDYYTTLAGYKLITVKETTKKYLKWQPFASQAQAGNVKLLRGSWNDAFLSELENLSENEKEYGHDDQGDAASGAFEVLTTGRPPRVAFI
jgi:predicted phage terminase large subunit-like protein